MNFDQILIVDWSASGKPSPARPSADAIWIGTADVATGALSDSYHRTRHGAEAELHDKVSMALTRGERLLIGADFAFGYPSGFAHALTETTRALAVWDWLEARLLDDADNVNNHKALAAAINAMFPGDGPFWGNGEKAEYHGLNRKRAKLPDNLAAQRATEHAAIAGKSRPKSVWQLAGAGVVGAQALVGMPALARLRRRFSGQVAVWPFEPCDTAAVVLAEVYPSLLAAEVTALMATPAQPRHETSRRPIKDAVQVRLLAAAIARLAAQDALLQMFEIDALPEILAEEGWILGVGAETALRRAAQQVAGSVLVARTQAAPHLMDQPAALVPPRLRNDCFAMPQGVDWVPVDDALALLRANLVPVTGVETMPLAQASGRVLATDMVAQRSNPPRANSAVDGYGFAHAATGSGVQRLALVQGRAAAGQPFTGAVPTGMAIRILTGAVLPAGVDCVVMEEDTATDQGTIAFDGPIKAHANTREAGEDVREGETALSAGHRLRAPDLALLAALGLDTVQVHRRLRVGVFSTGDEIVTTGAAQPHQIYDANRPMLLALAKAWGFIPVDLGHVPDDPTLIAALLDDGAARCDAVLTSGGASAGDEDHVSRLLSARGVLSSWRIAMKPGRPLALALWPDGSARGVPVFGLPGNPVAAFVCALIFARPALSVLSGAGWQTASGFMVPAAFSKRKKAGRREYLRARMNSDGQAEVFASEGSGRISGLSWATGLVELPDEAVDITPGVPVLFLPYGSYGL